MKKNARILILIISTLVVASAIGLSLYYKQERLQKQDKGNESNVKGAFSLNNYPRIENIPPNTAYVGSPYTFQPMVVVQGERTKISYELMESPDWIFLYTDRLFGVPLMDDEGEGKVVLRVYNGEIYMDYVYYIQVYEKKDLDNN